MAFDPDAYLAEKSAPMLKSSDFDPDAYLAESGLSIERPRSSQGETAVMQGIQGASGGFLDEASGLVEAGGRALGIKGAGGSFSDLGIAPGGPTLDPDILKQSYQEARDRKRGVLNQQVKDYPGISGVSNVAGSVVSPINKVAKGVSLVKGGALIGGIQGLGNSEADTVGGMLKDTAIGAGTGAAAGKAVGAIAPKVKGAADSLGQSLREISGKLAENATGATGPQSAKFAKGAGKELLDRGLIKFGDTAGKIANRTSKAMDAANKEIDSALQALDDRGVEASADNIVAEIEKKISSLKGDASQAGLVRKLEGVVDDIVGTGKSKIKISAAEETKRGFNKAAGNWMDKEAGAAGKAAYRAYKKEAESVARAADPALAEKFTAAKKTYGLLAPIQEAAERRAATQSQSQIGGVGDLLAAGAGGVAGGLPGLVGGLAMKHIIAPRAASSGAVTLNAFSKSLMKSPAMSNLSQKSPAAFQALAQRLESSLGSSKAFPRAAESEQASSPRGGNRWALDGVGKIVQSSPDLDPEILARAAETQAGKSLLIAASELTPGSRAMKDIISKLNSKFGEAK